MSDPYEDYLIRHNGVGVDEPEDTEPDEDTREDE